MKLAQEFIRLPLQFDADRLAEEVLALPEEAWQAHPTGFSGNSAVPLISVDGKPNDLIGGAMAPTPWLEDCPYIRQVLASFNVVFGRSRLMCLDGGAEVPNHCDVNYHWFTRVRIHIPVITFPEVEFHCAERMIHMAAGEAWIFDNWKMHRVWNPTTKRRVHLVADTAGSASFWGMVDAALAAERAGGKLDSRLIAYDPGAEPVIRTEKFNAPDVMPPAEVEALSEDLLDDLHAASGNLPEHVAVFTAQVRDFCRDWRMLWTLHADHEDGWDAYEALRNRALAGLRRVRRPLPVSSNGRPAQNVMLARVLVPALRRPIPGRPWSDRALRTRSSRSGTSSISAVATLFSREPQRVHRSS